MEWDEHATALAYREAYGHARAIVDASRFTMGSGYWVARKVPVEREAMVAAISEKMRIGDKMGYRRVHPDAISEAVDAVIEGRPPAC